jgi:hypothetical protein
LKNSTVENAIFGVKLGTDYNSESDIAAYNGGILYATGSHFINNQSDVKFLTYTPNSVSRLKKCNFTTSALLNDFDKPLKPHVSLTGVHGVIFVDNTFENTGSTTDYPSGQRGVGIYSMGSDFKVYGSCSPSSSSCISSTYSYFNDLDRGIASYGAMLETGVIQITSTKMTNVVEGVLLSGLHNSIVTNNEIKLGTGVLPGSYSGAYGIYLNATDGQKVQDNHIIGSGDDGYRFGIISNSSGAVSANLTYNNKLEKVLVGFEGINNNQKMQVKCNTLVNNYYDIGITSGTFTDQGYNQPNPVAADYETAPAGNYFSHTICSTSSPSTENEVWGHSSLSVFQYNHHNNLDRTPVCETRNIRNHNTGPNIYTSGSNACLDLLNSHVQAGNISTLNGQIIVLRSYLDGGGSGFRRGIITDPGAKKSDIFTELTKHDYLSDECLDAGMHRTDVFSDSERIYILLLNAPHSTLMMR